MIESIKLAGEVVQSFAAVHKALMAYTQRNAASLGLTVPQMGILNTVYAKTGSTLKEISERLQLPKSTASVVVEDLVKLGLIDRKAGADDRREVSLTVSMKGEELAKRSVQAASSYRAMERALQELQKDEIHTLLLLQEKILAALKESELHGFES